MKMKRAKAHGAKNKNVLALYNKLTDLVDNLAELIDIQELTDTIILQVSTKSVYVMFKPGNSKHTRRVVLELMFIIVVSDVHLVRSTILCGKHQ